MEVTSVTTDSSNSIKCSKMTLPINDQDLYLSFQPNVSFIIFSISKFYKKYFILINCMYLENFTRFNDAGSSKCKH